MAHRQHTLLNAHFAVPKLLMSTVTQYLAMQHGREVLGSCFVFCITICIWSIKRRSPGKQEPNNPTKSRKNRVLINKTQILRCNVSHHRMYPKKHGFTYPYLSVGIPVRSRDSNSLFSVDEPKWWKRGWFHVTAKDHLHRGCNGNTLSENLDAYLEKQVAAQ
jgi:hypothetical protein